MKRIIWMILLLPLWPVWAGVTNWDFYAVASTNSGSGLLVENSAGKWNWLVVEVKGDVRLTFDESIKTNSPIEVSGTVFNYGGLGGPHRVYAKSTNNTPQKVTIRGGY